MLDDEITSITNGSSDERLRSARNFATDEYNDQRNRCHVDRDAGRACGGTLTSLVAQHKRLNI